MSCAEYEGNLIQAWMDGSWQAAATCPFDNSIGALTFGFLMYGGFMTALYVRTQSMVIPLVVTVLGGTVAISRLPSAALQLVGMVLMLGLAASGYFIYVRAQNIA